MKTATSYHRTTCRLCEKSQLELVIPYPPTPIADAYVPAARRDEPQELFPLDLYLCPDCGHVQLCDVINPELLFANYTYETSISLGLVEHFRKYAEDIIAYSHPVANSLVVEIGSNDGSLLRFFKQQGLRGLGIDPARSIAEKATIGGIETLPVFFTSEVAAQIKKQHGSAAIVTANNVFAHADNMGDIAAGIAALLDQDGIFCFEVSYLPDIIEKKLFDTIYHEHLCYHAIKPLQSFFRMHGLELVDFIRIPTKGGSFRGIAQRAGGARPVMPSVQHQIEFEIAAGFDTKEPFIKFAAELDGIRTELRELLGGLKAQGKSIAGYGASATVTTLSYYFGLGDFINFLVDDNPLKFETFTPGEHLPVLPSQALYDIKPDYVVVLAWNYAAPIMAKHQAYRASGGKFIVPLPNLVVG